MWIILISTEIFKSKIKTNIGLYNESNHNPLVVSNENHICLAKILTYQKANNTL